MGACNMLCVRRVCVRARVCVCAYKFQQLNWFIGFIDGTSQNELKTTKRTENWINNVKDKKRE